MSNNNSLSKYLQETTVGVSTSGKTATPSKETLSKRRNEEEFDSVWQCAEI